MKLEDATALPRSSTLVTPRFARMLSAGDVLLVHQRWQIRSGEPRRGRFTQTVDAVLVLRHLEGEWKFSIAAPWGYGRAYD